LHFKEAIIFGSKQDYTVIKDICEVRPFPPRTAAVVQSACTLGMDGKRFYEGTHDNTFK
jgi:hypothetical protein